MVTQMAKYLDTVYVSGWQSSSTASASDEPGPDLADYPYVSTRFHSPVPNGLAVTTSCSPASIRPPSRTRCRTCSWPSSSTTVSSDRSA